MPNAKEEVLNALQQFQHALNELQHTIDSSPPDPEHREQIAFCMNAMRDGLSEVIVQITACSPHGSAWSLPLPKLSVHKEPEHISLVCSCGAKVCGAAMHMPFCPEYVPSALLGPGDV